MLKRIRAWFHDSETIFLARIQMAFGVVFAGLAAMDWSPLLSLAQGGGFSRSQVVGLFAVLAFQGIVTEIARRARATDL